MTFNRNIVHLGDCLDVLKTIPDNSVDAVVTDPPYELGLMGKSWDGTGIANDVELWKEVLRVLKPGGHLLSFGGTRTYHRMTCAIEDAGFEIRDCIMWCYGSGFPKSTNISKQIDKKFGDEREKIGKHNRGASNKSGKTIFSDDSYDWSKEITITAPSTDQAKTFDGFGTALKPAHEPIVLARKPLSEKTIAENCLKHGTGGINIDDCRIKMLEGENNPSIARYKSIQQKGNNGWNHVNRGKNFDTATQSSMNIGRFPANLILSKDVAESDLFPETKSGKDVTPTRKPVTGFFGQQMPYYSSEANYGDSGSGSASRFFKQIETTLEDIPPFYYCAKPSTKERNIGCEDLEPTRHADRNKDDGSGGDNPRNRSNKPKQNFHPTVKPIKLMEYLITLVTPPEEYNPVILDPFAGSGTTLLAAKKLGIDYIGIEKEEEYINIINARLSAKLQSAGQKKKKEVKLEKNYNQFEDVEEEC